MQVVQDVPSISNNIPMVLIKPPEACSTAEVYKVLFSSLLLNLTLEIDQKDYKICIISQRLSLDQTSKIDPLALLEKISKGGISQDVCINDLGMNT